ncbi:F-box domain [Macleaya cordata]|uniref:F-box domain n=1 Tax=Macleaya cordata TaxID=56857 RepID=A0A200R9C3_MACCD|nr:F-box domain [Macleaya cordata]
MTTTIGEISGDDNLLLENSSSSASVIASNSDLLIQILLRLPVKSLLAFKSVSKQWLSLISNSYFVHNHCLQYCPSIPGFFLSKSFHFINPEFEFIFVDGNVFGSGPSPGSIPFKTLNSPAGINIKQSCNGLLFCSSVVEWVTDNSYTRISTYYVYNPSTMHYKILPPSPFRKHQSDFGCYVSLAFDPLKSPHYEVICIWSKDRENHQIDIYSSKTDSWRLCGDDGLFVVNAAIDMFSGSGVFWNGSLHWIGSTGDSVYFDIDRELIRTMPMPPFPVEWDRRRRVKYFWVYKGHMHLIEMYPHMKGRFDILRWRLITVGGM